MPPRRLLIRPGAIGDVIVSLPALLAADATEIWTPSALVPIVKLAGFANTRAIASTGLDLVGIRGGAEFSRKLADFDEIISWYGTRQDAFREAVRDLPFRFLDALPPADWNRSATDFYLEQIGAPPNATPLLRLADARKEDYAVIHPFSGSPRKNWPLAHFETLAETLDMEVRWIAGPEETLACATRFDDLGVLAQFLAAAKIYVGNDSGITHLSAAAGVPTIAIFGPTNPQVWAPRGAHVEIVTPPDRADLASLVPAQVLQRIRSRPARY